MRIAELLVEAGLPKGVFQIVHGNAEVVRAMCDHPGKRNLDACYNVLLL